MIIPRYEYRCFGLDLLPLASVLRKEAHQQGSVSTAEVYLLTRKAHRLSAKMREDHFEIKELMNVEDGLEKWTVRMKEAFPLSRTQVEDEILPQLGIQASIRQEEYDQEELTERLTGLDPGLLVIHVAKRRERYVWGSVKAEFSHLLVNGALTYTCCLESEDKEALLEALRKMGLDTKENQSYPAFLKGLTGILPLKKIPSFPEGY